MSTANFYSQDDFPLYAIDTGAYYEKYCDDCNELFDNEEEICPYCGKKLEEEFNEALFDDIVYDIEHDLKELNRSLSFFSVELKGGYFESAQLYVNKLHYDNIEDIDNEDSHYYFDCCRSVCIRKYNSEYKRLLKAMDDFAKEHNMIKLAVSARFSNGETWYTKIA